MPHLKYYDKERETFKAQYENKLSNTEATHIYKRLASRYKLRQRLCVTTRSWGGNCSRYRIKVCNKPPVAILAHEIAHAIHWKTRQSGERWHCKRHETIMRRVLRVIETNLIDWKEMANKQSERRAESFEHRLQQKAAKVDYSNSTEGKLERTLAGMKRWKTKQRRAETALKKLNRRKKLYERLLAKSQ